MNFKEARAVLKGISQQIDETVAFLAQHAPETGADAWRNAQGEFGARSGRPGYETHGGANIRSQVGAIQGISA